MKIKTVNQIELSDWDKLVSNTYGRPYSFQQQDGCQDRGLFDIVISTESTDDIEAEMNDSIPEEVNGDEMGVKFTIWLARDPQQLLKNSTYNWETSMFWERNFYPNIQTIANDLCRKGLIKADKYQINIDW